MATPVTPQTPLSTQPPSRQRSEPYSSSSTGGGVMTPSATPQGHLQQQKSRESQGKQRANPPLVTEKSLEEFEVIPPNTVFTPQPPTHKQETRVQVRTVITPRRTVLGTPLQGLCVMYAYLYIPW